MKKLVCIFALIIISLFATASVKAYCYNEYYTVSDVWDVGGTVYGYSSTELSYCAGLYHDPVVSGVFLENATLLGTGYVEGYADFNPAIIYFAYGFPVAGQTYTEFADHYLIAYYQVYVPMYNGWYWYDPWQLGFMEIGGGYEAPGIYGFGYAYYWQSQYIYIGSTTDSMIYCGQTQCGVGQQFSPTGTSCSFQPTAGVCGEPEPPKPKVKIQSVGFKNDYKVKRLADPTKYVDPDDATPTWVRGRSGNDKFPVAYTRGNQATIFATFSVESAVPTITSAKIRMRIGNTNTDYVTLENVNVSANTPADMPLKEDNINLNLPNSDLTRMTDYDFNWQISFDNGANWEGIGKSEHRVHWLYGTLNQTNDQEPAFPNNPQSGDTAPPNQGLYDEALYHSTGALGGGSNDINVIAKKITTHIRDVIKYVPNDDPFSDNPLKAFTDTKQRQCSDNATILLALLRSIGIKEPDGKQVFYIGGNTANGEWHYYSLPGLEFSPQFPRDYVTSQYNRSSPEDDGNANPRFNFHSTILLNGKSYDPSYGIEENEVKFTEAVNSAGQCVRGDAANAFKIIRFDNARTYPSFKKFENSCNLYASGDPLPRNSTFVSQSIPSDSQVGQSSSVSITLQNNGTNTWRASEGYQLGSQSPENNFTWGINRVDLPYDVAPGQQVTFNFNITAPSIAGSYNFQWRMIQNGAEWFGNPTENIPIEVIGQVECSSGDQQACYWWGGYWNHQTCTCEGYY